MRIRQELPVPITIEHEQDERRADHLLVLQHKEQFARRVAARRALQELREADQQDTLMPDRDG